MQRSRSIFRSTFEIRSHALKSWRSLGWRRVSPRRASRRRRVGLVASEGTEEAQPLSLRPTIWNGRSTPFAEVTKPALPISIRPQQTSQRPAFGHDSERRGPHLRQRGRTASHFVEKGGCSYASRGQGWNRAAMRRCPRRSRRRAHAWRSDDVDVASNTCCLSSKARHSMGLPSRRTSPSRGKSSRTPLQCRERPRSGRGLQTARRL